MKAFLLFCLCLPALDAAPLPEGVDEPLLMETTMYLYRWVLDERDVERVLPDNKVQYWVRELAPELDEGDASRMLEVWLPQLDLQVSMRKADYEIPELKMQVRNDQFKIINVLKGTPPETSDGYTMLEIPLKEIESYGFARRASASYPEGAFLEVLRATARRDLLAYYAEKGEALPEGPQVVYFSPLSPLANDLWIFWENGGKLLRMASDQDLENPALWEKGGFKLRIFDIREQTVVHLNEVKGSNAYMTRDQVGRYLFNCIVLGKKVILTPPESGG
jgi:hypothetical protein